MIDITLNDFNKLDFCHVINEPEYETFFGISIDSRTIKPGEIFWALKGDTFDGHDYVVEAIKRGGALAVVSRKNASKYESLHIPLIAVQDTLKDLQRLAHLHREKYKLPILALTGTNGKTTTKEMIAWILQTKMNVHKTSGNFNNHIGTPLTLLKLEAHHEAAIIELGTNRPGEIKDLVRIVDPTAGLITNIGRGHLAFFSSIEGVAREKIQLFRCLKRNALIFLNRDDPLLPAFPWRRKSLWAYGFEESQKPRVLGTRVEMDSNGCGIWTLNKKTKIHLKIAGNHNVSNALAASAVALAYGMHEDEIKKALESYTAYDKRMQIIKTGTVTILNDSYNANPDSFIPAVATLAEMIKKKQGRKVVVLGDMLELGLQSIPLHEELMFKMLEYDISAIFTLGKECALAAQVLRDRGYEHIFTFDTHEQLAKKLKKYLKTGDMLLLKGSRGMRMEKVLAYL
jgi:UDP-N-acetylmuramoyl-tripeptide--D-alanyl-D-alanine ligase